eukprot:9489183-Pyramimonas_sp.AAC.2
MESHIRREHPCERTADESKLVEGAADTEVNVDRSWTERLLKSAVALDTVIARHKKEGLDGEDRTLWKISSWLVPSRRCIGGLGPTPRCDMVQTMH